MNTLLLGVEEEVDRLFDEAPDRFNERRTNPVTGGRFIRGLDPIRRQKRDAVRALRARLWFAKNGPFDAPSLPLSYAEREELKAGGLPHIVAWYARSLEHLEYDFDAHPSFEDYARGVMASEHNGVDFIKQDPELLERFPPRKLPGLDNGMYWAPRQRRRNKNR